MGRFDRYLLTTMYLDNILAVIKTYELADDCLLSYEPIDEALLNEISEQNEKFFLALADEQMTSLNSFY